MSSAWPLLVYVAATVVLVGAILAISYVLGERHRGEAAEQQFESGILPVGDARVRFSAKFYLVAILFVIFDLEAVFIFAWAIGFREAGWTGYLAVLVFIGILVAALIYEWGVGALDWAPSPRRRRLAARRP